MSLELVILISIFSLFIEALFSGSEIALVSSDKLNLERNATNGSYGSILALKLLKNPSTMLAVTLIGTNIAVITNTIVVTFYFLQKFGPKGELLALAVITPTVLLFGEIIPKTLFNQYTDKITPIISYLIYYIRIPFYPLVLLLKLFSMSAERLLGIQQNKARVLSREDLLFLIEEEDNIEKTIPEVDLNSIREGEREIIGNIFNLRDKTVEEVMIPMSEVISAPKEASLFEISKLLKKHGITRIPIFNERVDIIVGIIHGFDILTVKNLNNPASSIMKPPVFVPEFQKAYNLLVDLQKVRKGMAIVVNEYGGAEGIVTIEDVLEEIVGEIEDEFDKPEETIKKTGKSTYLLSGRVPIIQVNEDLQTTFDEEAPWDTIAGLILHKLKRMPLVGDTISISNVKLTVERMSDRAILKVKLKLREESSSTE
jgi:magnesium and cobalt exporter, CNNM family